MPFSERRNHVVDEFSRLYRVIPFRRTLATFLTQLIEEGVSVRWILLSSVLALVGIVGIYTAIPAWINVLLAGISVVLLVIEARNYRIERRRISFVRRPLDAFNDVKHSLSADDRSRILVSNGQTFVHDIAVSHLINNSDLQASLLSVPYVLPAQLKAYGGRFRRERVSKDSAIFNGPVLGWASSVRDLPAEKRTVNLVAGTFFDKLSSDYFSAMDTRRDGSQTVIDGRRLFIDRNGSLRDFDESWLLNGIGVSTIAVTRDGMFVLTGQSTRNVGEQGLLAPSGSGSLEPRDFGGRSTMSLVELAVTGANRELEEEASVNSLDIESSHFLGFGRWLNKAASPELFYATLLNVDSHELAIRKRRGGEGVYVDGNFCVRPALSMKDWDESEPHSLLPAREQGRISLPLGVCLGLLIHETRSPSTLLVSELRKRFSEPEPNFQVLQQL